MTDSAINLAVIVTTYVTRIARRALSGATAEAKVILAKGLSERRD